jgi:CoA:oxalate CoA-transferase
MAKSKALEGVVVLDLTHVLAGPFAVKILADFGADIIMIEPPKGGFYRQISASMIGSEVEAKRYSWEIRRNRRSAAIALGSPKGNEVFLELVRKADVVVQNYGPGVMDKMGLGYETLKEANPNIIYCAISGFGQTGPYKDKLAYDPIIQAASGIISQTGFPDGPPVKVGISVADYCGGVYAAIGMLIALYYKKVTGKGQMIDASMLDALFQWTQGHRMAVKMTGGMERFGNRFPAALLDAYKTKDDKYLMFTVQTDAQWESFLRLIGKEEIIAEKWDFLTRNVKRRDEAEGWCSEWARTKTLEEAIEGLSAVRIAANRITTTMELETDPHILAREMLVEINDPELGKISGIVAPAPKLSESPAAIDIEKGIPKLGQHTEEVLSGMLGYSKEKIAKLKEEGIVKVKLA